MEQNIKGRELASRKFTSLMYGNREIAAYLMATGEYRVRLYLPAGELLPGEKCYAYIGRDVNAARAAWKKMCSQWTALLAEEVR